MSQTSKAWIVLILSFAIWGFFPLFVRIMSGMRADEFLFVRISFSALLLTFYFIFQRCWRAVCREFLTLKILWRTALTGAFIALNWLFYIIAVNKNLSTQASMGYLITPLINVLFGKWFFEESLDKWKRIALVFGIAGVLYQVWQLGEFPYLALAVGASFGVYGGLRKKFAIAPVKGLYAELMILLPFVLIAWIILGLRGQAFDYMAHPSMILMCLFAGGLTLLPLLLYLYGVQFLPLSGVALAQYTTPSLQFLVAVYYFHEPFGREQWMAFILIWIGLGVYSINLIQSLRRLRK